MSLNSEGNRKSARELRVRQVGMGLRSWRFGLCFLSCGVRRPHNLKPTQGRTQTVFEGRNGETQMQTEIEGEARKREEEEKI
jgi:hypothetical protein